MPQNDPRSEMSSFDAFGIYSSASESNQRISSISTSTYSQGSDSISSSSFTWQFIKNEVPGLGLIPAKASGGASWGYDVSELFPGLTYSEVKMKDVEGTPSPGGFKGWLRTGSVARTYDGYQAIPVAVSCMHSYFARMAEMFFGPDWGQLVERDNIPYHQITGTQNAAQNYFWACPRQAGLPEGNKPYYYTNTNFIDFKSIYDSSVTLTSSAEVLMGRIFQASGVILALLSGGTLANYGASVSTDQVVRDTISEVQTSVDEENLSICSRLERIESAVAQLIALTTYNYYTGGARVDSPKTEKPATGIFDLLLSYLGLGRPASEPEPEPEPDPDPEEGE